MKNKSALEEQIGGSHYKTMKIQPMTYSVVNGLNACQHTAIKYITRYRSGKGSPLENIDKAIHTLQLLKELEGLTEDCPEGFSETEPAKPYSDTEDFVVDFSEELVEALYRRVDKIVEERLPTTYEERRKSFLKAKKELDKGSGRDAF